MTEEPIAIAGSGVMRLMRYVLGRPTLQLPMAALA